MRIGIGLPAAVPGAAPVDLGEWAVESERLGFQSLAVLDRLVYDNLDPFVALAAAAARTERVELMTTVLGVPWRQSAIVLGKQLASLDLLSGGRLTAGLALGGWPEDYEASDTPLAGRGAAFDEILAAMRRVWAGEIAGASGPIPALPSGRPAVLLGGLVPATFARIAALADGWVAPFFGFELLIDGMASAQQAWIDAGRPGRPRVVVERYFCLGPDAEDIADDYLLHYYGRDYFPNARADTLTTHEQLHAEIQRLSAAGCDDLVLFPCSGDLREVARLSEALDPKEPSRADVQAGLGSRDIPAAKQESGQGDEGGDERCEHPHRLQTVYERTTERARPVRLDRIDRGPKCHGDGVPVRAQEDIC
jgi:alkanesulfonate monooxygenase SsuD/methylene tetrahydromethanopterin reductase-like flavin-dependent oxidoreductase (luciferase family)